MNKFFKWLKLKFPFIKSVQWEYYNFGLYALTFIDDNSDSTYIRWDNAGNYLLIVSRNKTMTLSNFLKKFGGCTIEIGDKEIIVPKDKIELEIEIACGDRRSYGQ